MCYSQAIAEVSASVVSAGRTWRGVQGAPMDDSTLGETRHRMTNQTRLLWAISRADLPPSVKHYLHALAVYVGNGGWVVWPGQAEVARSMGVDARTVRRAKSAATERGLIRTAWRGSGSPAIEILVDAIEGQRREDTGVRAREDTGVRPENAREDTGVRAGRTLVSAQGGHWCPPEQTKEQTKEQNNARAHECQQSRQPEQGGADNGPEAPDFSEDERLTRIAREIIGPSVGLSPSNLNATRIREIVDASAGRAARDRPMVEWGGADPLDRERMLRSGIGVGLARLNGSTGTRALLTVLRLSVAAMNDAISHGEYPEVWEPDKPMTAADRISANKKREREDFAKRCVRLVAEADGQHGG